MTMTATATYEEAVPLTSGHSAFPWDTPVTPAIDVGGTRRMVSALPEETFELIVREAYLFRAGQIILDAMTEARGRRDVVNASRPPFLAFRRTGIKDAFYADLASTDEELALYARAVKRNADAMKCLRKRAELHIEEWLRKNDAIYHAGLVSEKLVADWHRFLARIETELNDFIVAVGCARNSLVSARTDAKGVRYVSEVNREQIRQAAALGEVLAHDVNATNALAEQRDQHLQRTAFAATFPRLPSFDFAASMQEAAELPVSFLQHRFGLILEQCVALRSVGLPALLEQVRQAEAQHMVVKESYLVGVWNALRTFSLEHYVDEDDLNEVARATEAMFERRAWA